MQSAVLRALEFDRIVEAVQSFALTPMGDERLARLAPSASAQKVAQWLAATSETVRYLASNALFPLRASTELPEVLGGARRRGPAARAAAPAGARGLSRFGRRRPRRHPPRGGIVSLISKQQPARRPRSRRKPTEVRDKIEPSGDVVDDASPELKLIRDRQRKQRTRLRGTLESFLRGRDTAKYLQDQVVTERNGRYVLVVKAEHRSSIPGIVHGASTSGASLFLEPLSTVEINNDIVALEEQEREEIHRILLALTDAFRARRPTSRGRSTPPPSSTCCRRARGSRCVDGVEPRCRPTAPSSCRRRAIRCVQERRCRSTIKIVPPATLPADHRSEYRRQDRGAQDRRAARDDGAGRPAHSGGRRIAAAGVPSVFADIGDEQSIDASLSTFSAHITNIAAMDRDLEVPALVLLDEVGSGTDPIEGGALGVAMVDHFRRRGATVIATSHYDALKTYASTTDGVTSAAFGFDADTFAPTYQLVYGSPGRSLALEIAGRLGLNPSIVAAARQHLSAREAQLAEHLAKIDRDMRALEHEHRLAARERETLEAAEARIRQREEALRQREETFRRRLNEELETQVRQARREIDDVIAELKAKTASDREAQRPALTTGDTGAVRSDARARGRRGREADSLEPATSAGADRAGRSRTGDRRSRRGRRARPRRRGDGGPRRHRRPRRARQAHARQPSRSARRRRGAAAASAAERQRHVAAAAARRALDRSERDRLQRRRSASPAPSGFSTNRCSAISAPCGSFTATAPVS